MVARDEGGTDRSTTQEFIEFLCTGPHDTALSRDQPVQPSVFTVLVPKEKKHIAIEDVANLGLGWRHSDRVLASDFDHQVEITAAERFTRPLAVPQAGEPPDNNMPKAIVVDASSRLWSGFKAALRQAAPLEMNLKLVGTGGGVGVGGGSNAQRQRL